MPAYQRSPAESVGLELRPRSFFAGMLLRRGIVSIITAIEGDLRGHYAQNGQYSVREIRLAANALVREIIKGKMIFSEAGLSAFLVAWETNVEVCSAIYGRDAVESAIAEIKRERCIISSA